MQFATAQKDGTVQFTARTATASTLGTKATLSAQVSMFDTPPAEHITLEEFESLALARLSVLKDLEAFKLRYTNKTDDELRAKLTEIKRKHLQAEDDAGKARADRLSHYILRMAYCRTADLRKWFISQEAELFRLELASISTEAMEEFLALHAPQYRAVEDAEMVSLKASLLQVARANFADKEMLARMESQPKFYKVHFTCVPEMVSTRRVLLIGGYAYVNKEAIAPLIVAEFKVSVSKGLADIARRWRDMFPEGGPEDSRLKPLVTSLATRSLASDYSAATAKFAGDVNLHTLPSIAAKHFPLCMTHLHAKLRDDHHLKHGGRQQLSLFLKDIGLSMEEALMFWKSAFAPRVPSDKFDKEYSYNIRHNYGKEGKRQDYTSHKCTTLIGMSGGQGDHHGCPYRRLDEASLRASLARLRCDDRSTDEAMRKARDGHYQLACACAFEGMHKGVSADIGISQPLQYYAESRRIHAERDAPAAAAVQQQQPADASNTDAGVSPMDITPGPSAVGAASGPHPVTGAGQADVRGMEQRGGMMMSGSKRPASSHAGTPPHAMGAGVGAGREPARSPIGQRPA